MFDPKNAFLNNYFHDELSKIQGGRPMVLDYMKNNPQGKQIQESIRRIIEYKGIQSDHNPNGLPISQLDAQRIFFGTDNQGVPLSPQAANVPMSRFQKALNGSGYNPKNERQFLNPDGSMTYQMMNPDGSKAMEFTHSKTSDDGQDVEHVITLGGAEDHQSAVDARAKMAQADDAVQSPPKQGMKADQPAPPKPQELGMPDLGNDSNPEDSFNLVSQNLSGGSRG